jgi:hypothetical protein
MTRIDDIKARLTAATPWPWEDARGDIEAAFSTVVGADHSCDWSGLGSAWPVIKPEDRALIANAPADLAYLLRVAEAARSVFAALDEHGLSRTIVPMMALRIALEHGDGIVE